MNATSALTPAELAASLEPTAAWSALTSETLGAWACAWDIWAGYFGRLAAAAGPLDVFEAGARLSLECIEICSRAAALRLGGLQSPLLTDS